MSAHDLLEATFGKCTGNVTREPMAQNMQDFLGELYLNGCKLEENKRKAALWNRNPITGKTLAGKFNDRSGREIHHDRF